MRAVVITAPGGPEALQLIDTPAPAPGPEEIRIRVAAAAVNPVDLATRAGAFHDLGWIAQPEHTGLGWDVAGTVSALGSGVEQRHSELAVGVPVVALLAALDVPLGTYADEVVVPADSAAVVPEGLDLVAAATLPLNALTAAQALDLLGPAAGRRLLVTGAAGAVGGYVVALAAPRGWVVDGLARETDREFVKRSGASGLVTMIEDIDEGSYDAVLDAAVLGDTAARVVRGGGHYVGVMPPSVPASRRGVTTEAVGVRHDGTRLQGLLSQLASGELEARVHATAPLTDAATAHRALERGGTRGRWVLLP